MLHDYNRKLLSQFKTAQQVAEIIGIGYSGVLNKIHILKRRGIEVGWKIPGRIDSEYEKYGRLYDDDDIEIIKTKLPTGLPKGWKNKNRF